MRVVRVVCGIPVYYKGSEGRDVLQTIAVAFAMFSALPVPQFEWNEKNMRYALCAFPLVGVVCGALWCVCGRAAPACGGPGGGVLPCAGMGHRRHPSGRLCRHLRRPFQLRRPRKEAGNFKGPPLRCLRGHPAVQLLCGVFCPVRLCAFTPGWACCWTLALVRERALSGFAVAAFPMAKNTGLAHTFATAADRTSALRLRCWRLCSSGRGADGAGRRSAGAGSACWFLRYHVVAEKQFGGITGDLAGWFLQKAELWMLAALCACQWGGL